MKFDSLLIFVNYRSLYFIVGVFFQCVRHLGELLPFSFIIFIVNIWDRCVLWPICENHSRCVSFRPCLFFFLTARSLKVCVEMLAQLFLSLWMLQRIVNGVSSEKSMRSSHCIDLAQSAIAFRVRTLPCVGVELATVLFLYLAGCSPISPLFFTPPLTLNTP